MSTKTKKPQNPLWQTNPGERKSYYSYFLGQNMIYNMLAAYLTTFLVFQGIDPLKSGAVVMAVKVWDAVNDAIFGVIFDKIKFKNGQKYIPWLKIACILTPISTVAVFIMPNALGETVKLIWFAIAYILWDTAYTICDVPAFGIITSMTSNVEERNTILSLKGISGGAGSAISTVLVTLFIGQKINIGYGPTSIIVAVVAAATMFPVCYKCNERNKSIDEEQFTVRRMLKYVVSNKYLLIYYLGYIFYSGAQTYNSLHLLTAYYIFGNETVSLVVGAVAIVPQLIMALLVPKIIRKMDKTKLFMICTVAAVLSSILVVPAKNSLVLFILAFTLRSIPLGVIGVLSFTFTPDCAEYGQYKTGTDAKGITFAIQTFAVKLAAAISGSLGLILLGFFDFKTKFMVDGVEAEVSTFADLQAINAISLQTPEALNGLWFTYNVVPIIGLAIAFILWSFYKLNDKDVQVMADHNVGKISREEAESLLSRKY